VGRRWPWIVRSRDLQIALRKFIGVAGAFGHPVGIDDRRAIVGNLCDEAVMRAVEKILDRLPVDDIGRVVDVQEAPVISPDLVPGQVEYGLVVDSVSTVLRVVWIVEIRRIAGREERERMTIRRRLRPVGQARGIGVTRIG
jgi:hypothetical protein